MQWSVLSIYVYRKTNFPEIGCYRFVKYCLLIPSSSHWSWHAFQWIIYGFFSSRVCGWSWLYLCCSNIHALLLWSTHSISRPLSLLVSSLCTRYEPHSLSTLSPSHPKTNTRPLWSTSCHSISSSGPQRPQHLQMPFSSQLSWIRRKQSLRQPTAPNTQSV